jgi:hypothetical protein
VASTDRSRRSGSAEASAVQERPQSASASALPLAWRFQMRLLAAGKAGSLPDADPKQEALLRHYAGSEPRGPVPMIKLASVLGIGTTLSWTGNVRFSVSAEWLPSAARSPLAR